MGFAKLRLTLLAALVVAASPVLTGCGDDDDDDTAGTDTSGDTGTATGDDDDSTTDGTTPAGTATVRALHGSPDAPAVDVYAGTTKLLTNVAFGQLSDALTVPADTELTLDFRATGADPTSAPAGSAKVGPVPADSEWLAIATGFLSKTDTQKFQLQAVPVGFADDAENTRLVAVHSSPDAPGVDVLAKTAEGDFQAVEGLTGLSFPGASAAEGKQLPPAALEIGVGAAGTTTPLVRYDITTTAGLRAYAVALGSLTGASETVEAFGLYLITAPKTGSWTISLLTPKTDETGTTTGDDDDDTTGTTGTDGTGTDGTGTDTDTTGTDTEGDTTTDGPTTASVAVFHAGADAPAVDIWVGTDRVVTKLAYGSVIGPLEVPAGTAIDFEIFAASDSATKPTTEPAFTFKAPALTAGTTTLAVATGLLTPTVDQQAFTVKTYAVDAVPSPTAAKLSVVHASPDATAVDVLNLKDNSYSALESLTDITFGDDRDIELPPDYYQIGIAGTGETEPIREYELSVAGNFTWFVIATGLLNGEQGQQPFGLYVIDTSGATFVADSFAPIDTASSATVYVFHGIPDAPALDAYRSFPGARKLVSNLSFGNVTARPVRLPAGVNTLDFRLAGAAPDSTALVAANTAELEAGVTYVVTAAGFLADTGATGFTLVAATLQPVPETGFANVQGVHASPDAPAVDIQEAIEGFDLLSNAAYGQSGLLGGGGLTNLNSGSFEWDIAAGGTTEPLLSFTVNVAANYRYVVIAAGSYTKRQGSQPFGLWALPFAPGAATLSATAITLFAAN
jgi:hypothetical protein